MKFLAAMSCAAVVAALPAFALSQPAHSKHHVVKTKAHQKAHKAPAAAEDDPVPQLTPGELDTARKVYTGDIPCELGQHVNITPYKVAGFFTLSAGKQHFRMQPVESRTGAIRLEDPKGGAVWIQLGNKSMLMSQKLGERLADECKSPEQVAVSAELMKHPMPSILDPLPAAKPQADAAAPSTAAAPQTTAAAPSAAAAAPGAAGK